MEPSQNPTTAIKSEPQKTDSPDKYTVRPVFYILLGASLLALFAVSLKYPCPYKKPRMQSVELVLGVPSTVRAHTFKGQVVSLQVIQAPQHPTSCAPETCQPKENYQSKCGMKTH
jgi:hypothetical protein